MSDENLPTGNTAVFQLLAIIATAFASAGAFLLLTGGSVIGLAALAFSIFLFIVGLKWSVVRRHTGEQFVVVADRMAKYRNAVFLSIAAGTLIYGVFYVYNIRKDLDKYVMPRTVTAKQSAHLEFDPK